MEEWKQRLRSAREGKGLTKTAFAKAVGVSNPTVTDWEKSTGDGGIKEISGPKLTKVSEVLGVDPRWLLDGRLAQNEKKDVFELVPGAIRVRAAELDDPDLTQIMKVKLKVQAGITGFQVEPEHYEGDTHTVKTSWIEQERFAPEALLATIVKGDSMAPSLHHGDTIIVNTRDTKPVSGKVYVVNYEGEAVVKRMLRDAGQWWLASDNPDQVRYHRQRCKGTECIIIGLVVRKESTHI